MPKKYRVLLTEEERARLRTPVGGGRAPARRLAHNVAWVLDGHDWSAAGAPRRVGSPMPASC